MPDWHIQAMDDSTSDGLLSFVADHFTQASPLHNAVNITPAELTIQLQSHWHEYSHSAAVAPLLAITDEQIIGCIIPAPFPTRFSTNCPDKQKPIASLLQSLETQYLSKHAPIPDSLLVDIAAVDRRASGQGIYQILRTELHIRTKAAGYSAIYGALSSATTQHVCINKLHQRVVSEVRYSDFMLNNKRPFASIQNPPSIQLVEAIL